METDKKYPGMCFGYDGLMLKKLRTSSVLCLEDCHIFILSDENFELSIGRSILKGDTDRKQFLLNRIPAFKENKKFFVSVFKDLKTVVS